VWVAKRARSGPKADERSEQLIAAGYRTALRGGLAGLRTRDVATEAGVTVATLHYYFPTKEDLVRGIVGYAIRERIIVMLVDSAPEGLPWLRAMLTGLRKQADEEPGHFRLLHELIWISHTDPAVHALLDRWHGDWHAALVRHLEAGQRQGDIRSDMDTAATAAMIMYLALGTVLRPAKLIEHDAQLLDELDRLLGPPAS
jgi:AcrR family transcriptional regulator